MMKGVCLMLSLLLVTDRASTNALSGAIKAASDLGLIQSLVRTTEREATAASRNLHRAESHLLASKNANPTSRT